MKKQSLLFLCLLGTTIMQAQNDGLSTESITQPRNQIVNEPPRSLLQPGAAAELLTGLKQQPFAVINGAGTFNYIPKFTPTGIEIGNSQIYDNGGNVGIATSSPGMKLEVQHGGSSGIRVRSSAGFSVLDIDAFNGDAALRFARAASYQWLVGNNYITNGFQVYEFGGAIRLFIQDATGNVGINTITPSSTLTVNGTFASTGPKAFTIDHPLDPENKLLRHFAIESNEVLNSYSGNVITNEKGVAVVHLPKYFEKINKDFRYQLTVIGSFAQAIISGKINNNQFEIATSRPNVEVSWEVKAVRNDKYIQQAKARTEEEKPANMKGKYLSPEAYGLPETRGTNMVPDGSTNGAVPVTENTVLKPAPVAGSIRSSLR